MTRTRFFVILVALALACSAATAGSERTRLPNGEVVELMHPGVDGVSAPAVVEGTGVAPAYPDRADPFGEDSQVTIAVFVRDDGSVGHAEVLEARHPGMGFEESAITAVQQWHYHPAMAGDRAVHSYHVVRLNFRAPTLGPGANPGILPDVARMDGSQTILVRGENIVSPPLGPMASTLNRPASVSWPIDPVGGNGRTPTPINLNRPCMGGLCGSPTRSSQYWSVQPRGRSETPTPMPQVPSRGRTSKK